MISTFLIGLCLNGLGLFLDLVGVATNYWVVGYKKHSGLFILCDYQGCGAVKLTGRYKSMQFLSCVGFLLLLTVSIMAIVYKFKTSLHENLRFRRSLGIIMITGGACAFIGAMMGVARTVDLGPGWSLGLAAGGGIISLISGILVIVGFKPGKCFVIRANGEK